MTYVLEMSTDRDIIGTHLEREWHPVTRYDWQQVNAMGIGLPGGADMQLPGLLAPKAAAEEEDLEEQGDSEVLEDC